MAPSSQNLGRVECVNLATIVLGGIYFLKVDKALFRIDVVLIVLVHRMGSSDRKSIWALHLGSKK